jgi:N-sulfoglucosamine sulfohydrolase
MLSQLCGATQSLIWPLIAGASLDAQERPNIPFCIANDWGWPHAVAYGDPGIKTPASDLIARQGCIFAALLRV